MERLTARQARLLAIGAQGLTRRRSSSRPNRRHLRQVLQHTKVLQIDSVNVVTRAHYLPAWSRVGAYQRSLLDRMAYRDRELFEYWGHEATLLPVELHPLMRWRMDRARSGLGMWKGISRFAAESQGFVDHILGIVREQGPVTAAEIAAEEQRSKDNWGWNWSREKTSVRRCTYS